MARMLSRQAHDGDNPAQFIVTTFHPQVRPCSFANILLKWSRAVE